MSLKKRNSEIRLAGKYIDHENRRAHIDNYGALKVVTLNYMPGRFLLKKGFEIKALAAWGEDNPRTTEKVWEFPYDGIDLISGEIKTVKSSDGDELSISVLMPNEDGSIEEIFLCQDLKLYQGESYEVNSEASVSMPKGCKIKTYYKNVATEDKDIYYSLSFYR